MLRFVNDPAAAAAPKPTVRDYTADGITVRWEPRFCIHSGLCVRDLPLVFDRTRRPWIDPAQAPADAIADVVLNCPSGALHFTRTDGGAEEEAPPASIAPQPDGPLYLRGRVTIVDEDGAVIREDTRVALCRCGASKHKPFCDGTHEQIGFKSV
jgi:uncharacterized Fe-S cluster protein YjdI